MVTYSHDGQFKSIQMIDKDLMIQPEGICFAPDGTLYISSEGKHGEPAKLFRYDH
jgi:sugar lactone lactonase YvrE